MYTNLYILIFLSLILIDGKKPVSWLKTKVFLRLIVRKISEHVDGDAVVSAGLGQSDLQAQHHHFWF